MPEEDKNKVSAVEDEKLNEDLSHEESEDEANEFDFGGLPDDTPFKRNIGCGG